MNADAGEQPPPPWPETGVRAVGDFRIFSLRTARRRSPRTGAEQDFHVIDCADWVNVVALTPDRRVVLVEQFRHGVSAVELEVPGGIIDPDDPDPVAAGVRELREETGYAGSDPRLIGTVLPNSAIQSNLCHTVLVRDCVRVGAPEPDEAEDIRVRAVPLDAVAGLVASGRIRHSLAVAALYHHELWSRTHQ
jgi:8-oxo-dGTP pyrophosphatase MutT (NUDIX family)